MERQREIERQNALADAWKKVMDDINSKMNDMITDQLNALLQNQSIDANTKAMSANTEALGRLTDAVLGGGGVKGVPSGENFPFPVVDDKNSETWGRARRKREGLPVDQNPHDHTKEGIADVAQAQIDASNAVTEAMTDNAQKQVQVANDTNEKIEESTSNAFAKMTQAVNLYGIAYQAMSNDNLSATQKFQMIALQAVGNAAIAALTTNFAQTEGQVAIELPGILGKAASQLGPIAGPIAFAAMTALLGGLMGMAVSKITKSKATIAQATGASSASAGRLTTGMLNYAEGNVNEFTDPSTLTPGRQYNVDAANGKTYRARYMGSDPRTHLTNGPEFHLVGEEGREAIIDAHTTRLMQMNDTGIWRAIQTLYNGGSLRARRRSRARSGVLAFADGNLDDFADMGGMGDASGADMEAMRQALDRNSAVQEALLERLSHPIQAKFDVHGPGGLVDSYDRGKKTATRHGERY